MRLVPGHQIGPYEVQSLLGEGGMGEVYIAEDPRLHRTVAIKVLSVAGEATEARRRITREARAVAALDPPHICTVFDVGHEQGLDYIVMAFVEGETGRRVFDGDTAWQVAAAIVHETPPRLSSLRSGIPEQLDRAVERALAKDPAARWQTMAEMRAHLEACRDTFRTRLPSAVANVALDATEDLRQPWPVTAMVVINALFATSLLYGSLLMVAFSDPSSGPPPMGVPMGVVALATLSVLGAVGLFLRRSWGRWIEQGLAALALLLFPFGTILGTAGLGYLHRPGVRLLLSGRPSRDLTREQRAVVERDVRAPKKWVYALPALAVGASIPLAIVMSFAIPTLFRQRIAVNEAGTIAHIRSIQTAQRAISRVNAGFFLEPDCLTNPRSCLPAWASGPLLASDAMGNQRGYSFEFHPGPAVQEDEIARRRAVPQSLSSYAVMASPIEPGVTGVRVFCGDSSGRVSYAVAHSNDNAVAMQVVDGRCAAGTEVK